MSIDFEFRNKQRMWTYKGTPTYSELKKYFESGRAGNVKVIVNTDKRTYLPGIKAFSLDCGGGCWIHFYDTRRRPTIKMSHFDHVEKAISVLQKAAAYFDVIVLNDLEHGDSDIWAAIPPGSKLVKKETGFKINIKPFKISNLSIRPGSLKNKKKLR